MLRLFAQDWKEGETEFRWTERELSMRLKSMDSSLS
jgi:hypothetical protein